MKKLFNLTLLIGLLFVSQMEGQIRTPAPSPSAKIMQTVGLTDVEVEYSRPGKKGRDIFGSDALVPYGKLWRTGANQATKISFSTDVKVGGKELAAGSYAILTKPERSEWAVNFYTYETGNSGSYVEKEPAAVVTAVPQQLPFTIESFTIMFGDLSSNSASLGMMWDDAIIQLPLSTDVDGAVMASIDKTLAGPTSGDYYAAGSYYHDSGKDLEKALKWVRKATKTDSPRYWQVRKESLILADMGKYKEAIAAAKLSLDLATKAGNDDYVKMNNDSIAKWMKK